jgi:hypothetical protein
MREQGSIKSSSKVIFDILEATCFSNSSAMSSIPAVLMLQALYQTKQTRASFCSLKSNISVLKSYMTFFAPYLFFFLFALATEAFHLNPSTPLPRFRDAS